MVSTNVKDREEGEVDDNT